MTFCANVAASHPVAFVFGATSVHPDPANSGEPRVSLGELMENWVLDCILLIASMHARLHCVGSNMLLLIQLT